MNSQKKYSIGFAVPALVLYLLLFLIPMIASFFFSLTVWDLNSFTFCGLDNFRMFFSEHSMNISLRNTIIYAAVTCSAKVLFSFLIALLLTSNLRTKNVLRAIVFFPTLVSTIAIGIIFSSLMHPTKGCFNLLVTLLGFEPIGWLQDKNLALWSVMGVDIWKGVGFATVIFLAGLESIDKTLYEAAEIDGAGYLTRLNKITLPLIKPSRNTIIILSLIGGLRSFDLIWAMTGGGPGFATDVLSSVIYKQYAAGFYGLSTAGNVIMFLFIAIIIFPLQNYLYKKEEI